LCKQVGKKVAAGECWMYELCSKLQWTSQVEFRCTLFPTVYGKEIKMWAIYCSNRDPNTALLPVFTLKSGQLLRNLKLLCDNIFDNQRQIRGMWHCQLLPNDKASFEGDSYQHPLFLRRPCLLLVRRMVEFDRILYLSMSHTTTVATPYTHC